MLDKVGDVFGGLSAVKIMASVGGSAVATGASIAVGDWSLAMFGVPLTVLLAAFGGSVLSLSFVQAQRAWYFTVGAGTMAGAYGTPLAAHALSLSEIYYRGVAFGIAALLPFIVPAVGRWIQRKGDGNA